MLGVSNGVPAWVATTTLSTISGTLNLTSQVAGILAVPNGGTGWANINAGYIPFGNGASALSTSTNLFWDSTNSRLGIGTTTPNNLLDLYSTSKSALGFSGASGSTYKWTLGMDVSNGGRFSIASSTALGTTDRFVIDGSGNVGIGTTTPSTALSVSGTGYFSSAVGIGTNAPVGNFDVRVGVDQRFDILSIGGILTLRAVNDANAAYSTMNFNASQYAFTNGNVGIGTTPTTKLHVVKATTDALAASNATLLLDPGSLSSDTGASVGFGTGSWQFRCN